MFLLVFSTRATIIVEKFAFYLNSTGYFCLVLLFISHILLCLGSRHSCSGSTLSSGAGLGAGPELLGGLSSVSTPAAESPEQGRVWSQQGLPPGPPKREPPSTP